MARKLRLAVDIKGPGAEPQKVGASELADILRHIESAILTAAALGESDSNHEGKPALVALASIKKGKSIDMGFYFDSLLRDGVTAITHAIVSSDYSLIPNAAQEELSCLSKLAVKNHWTIEIESKQAKTNRAIISTDNQVPEPSNATVTGETTIWGYLIRVGGRQPSAVIRLTDDSKLTITVSKRLAKELGNRLYDDVGIEGIATWRIRDWQLLAFAGNRLTEYNPQTNTIKKTFSDLANASESRFENAATNVYINKVRYEE